MAFLSEIVKSQAENVVLQEEWAVERLQDKCLSVGMRLIVVGLLKCKNSIVLDIIKWVKINFKQFLQKEKSSTWV